MGVAELFACQHSPLGKLELTRVDCNACLTDKFVSLRERQRYTYPHLATGANLGPTYDRADK